MAPVAGTKKRSFRAQSRNLKLPTEGGNTEAAEAGAWPSEAWQKFEVPRLRCVPPPAFPAGLHFARNDCVFGSLSYLLRGVRNGIAPVLREI
jgi:hypothetical protein